MPDSPSRPKFRFSLLNSILLVTAAGLAFGVWHKDRELRPLRQESAAQASKLHELRGGIDVIDPTRMYVKAPDSWLDPLWHERFFVYVPANADASVRLLHTVQNASGVEEQGANDALPLEPGYSSIDIFVSPVADGRGWRWELGVPNSSVSGLGPRPPWMGVSGTPANPAERHRTPPEGLPADIPFNIIDESTEQADGARVRTRIEVQWTDRQD